jgi:hypothetical protein
LVSEGRCEIGGCRHGRSVAELVIMVTADAG